MRAVAIIKRKLELGNEKSLVLPKTFNRNAKGSTKYCECRYLPGGIRPTIVSILGISRGLLEFGFQHA